jgi:hypothetical protein
MFSIAYRLPLPQICSILFQFPYSRLAGVCLVLGWNRQGGDGSKEEPAQFARVRFRQGV